MYIVQAQKQTSYGIIAKVKVPYHLRDLVEGQSYLNIFIDGFKPTIRNVIELINKFNPELTKNIVNDRGELNSVLSLYLNDKNIKYLNRLDTVLEESTNEISIRPSIAGG